MKLTASCNSAKGSFFAKQVRLFDPYVPYAPRRNMAPPLPPASTDSIVLQGLCAHPHPRPARSGPCVRLLLEGRLASVFRQTLDPLPDGHRDVGPRAQIDQICLRQDDAGGVWSARRTADQARRANPPSVTERYWGDAASMMLTPQNRHGQIGASDRNSHRGLPIRAHRALLQDRQIAMSVTRATAERPRHRPGDLPAGRTAAGVALPASSCSAS
jgi:hypothetical protein